MPYFVMIYIISDCKDSIVIVPEYVVEPVCIFQTYIFFIHTRRDYQKVGCRVISISREVRTVYRNISYIVMVCFTSDIYRLINSIAGICLCTAIIIAIIVTLVVIRIIMPEVEMWDDLYYLSLVNKVYLPQKEEDRRRECHIINSADFKQNRR